MEVSALEKWLLLMLDEEGLKNKQNQHKQKGKAEFTITSTER